MKIPKGIVDGLNGPFARGQHFLTPVERPLDTLGNLHNVVFLIVLD